MARNENWTEQQLKLALHLYFQLPFGQYHQKNIHVIKLAEEIGRTPSAVAMKLGNIASLDPAIIRSGRSGLSSASALDKRVWAAFHKDWSGLVEECEALRTNEVNDDFTGSEITTQRKSRVGQSFFRNAVLTSYEFRCCVTGITDKRLLNASHIVPWSAEPKIRLNPSNGLCLSALHDRAFDRGLITLDENNRLVVSAELSEQHSDFAKIAFIRFAGKQIELPKRFEPDAMYLEHHRNQIFIDAKN